MIKEDGSCTSACLQAKLLCIERIEQSLCYWAVLLFLFYNSKIVAIPCHLRKDFGSGFSLEKVPLGLTLVPQTNVWAID